MPAALATMLPTQRRGVTRPPSHARSQSAHPTQRWTCGYPLHLRRLRVAWSGARCTRVGRNAESRGTYRTGSRECESNSVLCSEQLSGGDWGHARAFWRGPFVSPIIINRIQSSLPPPCHRRHHYHLVARGVMHSRARCLPLLIDGIADTKFGRTCWMRTANGWSRLGRALTQRLSACRLVGSLVGCLLAWLVA